MSLDFYLHYPIHHTCEKCHYEQKLDSGEVCYRTNITHNLNSMAEHAGIYKCLWRPEENDFKFASDIILSLELGIQKLESDPLLFSSFNPSNGWGRYENLLEFAKEVLHYCKEYPDAFIKVSR